MSMQPGESIGAYRIVEQIGQGGMGTVYKAYDPALDRHVAIKVLPPYFSHDATFRRRFQQEAVAVARLRHPNIVVVFASGQEGDSAYLVTELVDGGTLQDLLGRPIAPAEVASFLTPVAAALDYAHGEGVVHRDIKPSNILLSERGVPILADFGLALLLDSDAQLTRTGQLVGTPAYMAPEYVTGGGVGAAADRYALGIIAYQMLTGRVPYVGDTPMAVLIAQAQTPLPPARALNPSLPEAVDAVLARGLAKIPGDRYPSATDFARALQVVARGEAAGQALPPQVVEASAVADLAPISREAAPAGAGAKSPDATDPVAAPPTVAPPDRPSPYPPPAPPRNALPSLPVAEAEAPLPYPTDRRQQAAGSSSAVPVAAAEPTLPVRSRRRIWPALVAALALVGLAAVVRNVQGGASLGHPAATATAGGLVAATGIPTATRPPATILPDAGTATIAPEPATAVPTQASDAATAAIVAPVATSVTAPATAALAVSGNWIGEVAQQFPDGSKVLFISQLSLAQSGSDLSGSATITATNRAYVTMSVLGRADAGGIHLDEGQIIRTNAPNGPFSGGGGWCLKHLDLQGRPANGGWLLSGTWQSPGCGRGTAFELRK